MINNIISLLKKYYLIIIAFLFFILFSIIIYNFVTLFNKNDYERINYKKYNNLMIINEPSDELIYAGDHLLSDSYVVICISCKRNMDTLNFANIIKYTGDDYVLLYMDEYKDDERILYDEEELTDYLKPIINEKNWKSIVTYNKDGQYGDMNNKQICNIVANLVEDKSKLYYFGNYYSKNEIRNHYDELVPIKNKNKKLYLLGLYNKEYLFDAYSQILDYESFISYEEWGE